MGKILGIDYGTVMTGLSITDEQKIFSFGLISLYTEKLFIFLDPFLCTENIEKIVIGCPRKWNNKKEINLEKKIIKFIHIFHTKFPNIDIERIDERFTSKMAFYSMIELGFKKKQRKEKKILHTISATIILQSYLKKQEIL
ncbi:RuvX/YqgF family protein [Blattabacterium cuenoti]|uniref:RuvX/YqgF family protein n=1 Tax=Blattabacterium cuenoti TaxID=1653831 RepID=UPI00163C12BD|nr:RuvX/YqgF family protein [Blattabacterium cuenoti]